MFKDIFTFTYHHKLVENFAVSSLPGALVSNIIGPIFTGVVLYDVISPWIFGIWIVISLIIFGIRNLLSKKLLKTKNRGIYREYIKFNLVLIIITALFYVIIAWLAVLNEANELQIFILSFVLIASAAGAIGTLGNIIVIYVLYLLVSLLPLVIALLYHGGEIFNLLSIIITVFMIAHIVSGYRYYIILRNSISLQDTFQTIYDKSSDGILLIENNRFKDCNESVLKMFGYKDKKSFLNTHLDKLSPNFQPDGTNSKRKMLLMLGKASKETRNSFEWVHRSSDGKNFWCEIVLTRINLDGNDLMHGVWRDISDRKILEIKQIESQVEIESLNDSLKDRVKEEVNKNRKKDQLLLAQSRLAQMGEMLSMIAHQWRQPLAAISSTSSALELKANLGKVDKELVIKNAQNISKYAQHLSVTIDDFRDFFKPNKEQSSVTYCELIESVLLILEVSLETKQISLIQNCNCGERFYTHSNEMKQVILNLIKNAEDILVEKAIEEPCVKLTTHTLEGKYILEVSDNGGGIPQEIIDKIFDPYFSTKLDKNGTGLGLYMSKIIVEEHCGGELNVSNNEDGAVFQVVIPTI